MKIASMAKYTGDLTLRWLNGVTKTSDGALQVGVLLRQDNGETFVQRLPFRMLPFLTPGLVVSQGEVLTTRRGGKSGWAVIPDLSRPDVLPVLKAFTRSHYNLGGHLGGEHRILRYQSGDWKILIPTMELIRFLFLHGKVMADAILQPMGLTNLAITPAPGLYSEILIEFQSSMPRALMRPEFVQEFAWAAVHPDGRKAWDSVRRLSQGQRSMTLEPPPLRNCRIEFRGIAQNKTWLVLEITALSGRNLPAAEIAVTHPSERERSSDPFGSSRGKEPASESQEPARPVHVRDHIIQDEAKSQEDVNQAIILLGGKRGVFTATARVAKILSPHCRRQAPANADDQKAIPRKTRSDAGHPVDPTLPPKVVTRPVSIGESANVDGLPPIEVSMLEPADWSAVGDLGLLVKVLQKLEKSKPDLTLTVSLVFLKPGLPVSYVPHGRRACLVAAFISSDRPPCVLLDVDHNNLAGGLSGLILRYTQSCPLADMERHVKQLLDHMVDRYGRWDNEAESTLPNWVTVERLPKLLRKTKRENDDKYVKRWQKKLGRTIWK